MRFFFILWCFIKSSQPWLRSFPQLTIRLCGKTGQEDDLNFHTRHLHFKYAELQWGITVMGIIVIVVVVVVVVVMIYDYDYDYDCILCDPLQFFFLSHVWAAIPQLIDITLSARYGRYQGWLGTVHFQLPIPGLCIPRDSSKCTDHDGFYCHSRASVDFFNFVRQLFLLFHLFLLSSKDLGPLAQLYR